VDEFRKSELFSNFQTAISLLHDQKGLDIIGELLANPELVEGYLSNGAGLQGLIHGKVDGSGKSSVAGRSKSGGGVGEIKPTDGDIGVDFSHLVDELPSKAGAGGVEIAGSVDSSPDYYSAIDGGGDKVGRPATPLSSSPSTTRRTSTAYVTRTTKPTPMEALPDIMESIDEFPEDMEYVRVDKAESVKFAGALNTTQFNGANANKTVRGRLFNSEDTAFKAPRPSQKPIQVNSATASTFPSRVVPTYTYTTTRPPVTRRNFRKSNDYYSMYYDDG